VIAISPMVPRRAELSIAPVARRGCWRAQMRRVPKVMRPRPVWALLGNCPKRGQGRLIDASPRVRVANILAVFDAASGAFDLTGPGNSEARKITVSKPAASCSTATARKENVAYNICGLGRKM